jgi:osmotically-inducible protein OsmY
MADRPDYRDDRSYRDRERHERPMTERAGDEVRSWFGDDEAARRRRMDELREERQNRDWSDRASNSAERAWDRARDTARDWTDRDRDGRRGLAEYADNDRPQSYSSYSRPFMRDDYNYAGDVSRYSNRDRGFGDTSRYATPDRYATSERYDTPDRHAESWPSRTTPYGTTHGWETANYSGRGPRGYQRSDDRIREDVCDRLTDDPRIDASDIEVNVKGGELTLSGSVRTRDEKRFAEDLAERLSGIREVNNNLKVKSSTEVLGTARSGASVLGLNDTPPPQSRK